MLEECGFWKQYSKDLRKPAGNVLARWYWLARAALRAFAIILLARGERPSPSTEHKTCDLLLVYFTRNQRNAFGPWLKNADAAIQTASNLGETDWHISWRQCAILTLRYLLPIYRLLCKRDDSHETIPCLEEFVRYQAGLILAEELFNRVSPMAVGTANDHSGISRAFIRKARAKGMRVIYTQHASVGNGFPALDFDLSLLDGLQAYQQYLRSGPARGEIVITGRHHIETREARSAPSGKIVGLATNKADSLLTWHRLMRGIRAGGFSMVMRCHPAERRLILWRLLCRLHGAKLDTGTLAGFLARIDVMVSGLSGTILDAAIRGISSLVFMPTQLKSPRMEDYYGFERFGLCRRISIDDDPTPLLSAAIAARLDPSIVGVFEAGLFLHPDEEKRKVVSLFMQQITRGTNIDLASAGGYIRTFQTNGSFLSPLSYAEEIDRHGWLDTGTASSQGAAR